MSPVLSRHCESKTEPFREPEVIFRVAVNNSGSVRCRQVSLMNELATTVQNPEVMLAVFRTHRPSAKFPPSAAKQEVLR